MFRKEKQLRNHQITWLFFALNRWKCLCSSHTPDHNETHRHNNMVMYIWNANTMQIMLLLFSSHRSQQETTAQALVCETNKLHLRCHLSETLTAKPKIWRNIKSVFPSPPGAGTAPVPLRKPLVVDFFFSLEVAGGRLQEQHKPRHTALKLFVLWNNTSIHIDIWI